MTKKGFARSKSVDLKKAELFISGAETVIEPQIKETLISNEESESDVKDKKQVNVNEEKTIKQQEKNKEAKQKKMPWTEGDVRIFKGINLRLNEVQWLKLKYITENTPYSMQKFIMRALEPSVEKELKKILGVEE